MQQLKMIIGHLTNKYKYGDKYRLRTAISFDQDSILYRITLIKKQTKLLITDYKRNLLQLLDIDGKILKLFNPNNILKFPIGVCVLHDPNEENFFFGDDKQH